MPGPCCVCVLALSTERGMHTHASSSVSFPPHAVVHGIVSIGRASTACTRNRTLRSRAHSENQTPRTACARQLAQRMHAVAVAFFFLWLPVPALRVAMLPYEATHRLSTASTGKPLALMGGQQGKVRGGQQQGREGGHRVAGQSLASAGAGCTGATAGRSTWGLWVGTHGVG